MPFFAQYNLFGAKVYMCYDCVHLYLSDTQSANKQFHSAENALLKVDNDINLNIYNGKVTALTRFDLSAAFDTTDHDILISRLSALLWCPPGFCFGALAFHSVYNTTKLSYPESPGSASLCR